MKRLNSLDELAKEMGKMIQQYDKKLYGVLEFSGKTLQKEGRDKIGHLQGSAGPFREWAELSAYTKSDKEKKGYVFNSDYNPLLRTGELRESIKYSVKVSMGYGELKLGSESQTMVWQEEGTSKIPPRSIIGATMFQGLPIFSQAATVFFKSWLHNDPLEVNKIRITTYHS